MLKKLLELLQKHVNYTLSENDLKSAFQAYNVVNDWLNKKDIKRKDRAAYDQIINYLNQLKFIALNYFDGQELVSLLKSNFPLIFKLANYNLWEKLQVHLVSTSDINERVKLKEQMRSALEKCEAYLITPGDYKNVEMVYKVSDWLKDFFIHINKELSNSIKQAEYLSKNPRLKKLKIEDRVKVLTLLEIYKKLTVPSNTKEGYENTVILEIDGQKYIYDHGQVERLPKMDLSFFGIEEDSPVEDRLIKKVSPKKEVFNDVLSEEAIKEEKVKEERIKRSREGAKNLAELKAILNEYPLSSLEYKAVKQEIKHLEDKKKYEK